MNKYRENSISLRDKIKDKGRKMINSKEVNITINSFDKLAINWDSNYFDFTESKTTEKRITKKSKYKIKAVNSNDSMNLSYEKIDEKKEFPERNYFIMLNKEKNLEKILTPDQWSIILNKDDLSISQPWREKIVFSLMSGIPANLRGKIWKFMTRSRNISLNHNKNFYNELIKIKNEEIELVIKKDIERTIVNMRVEMEMEVKNFMTKSNIIKEKKKNLFDILKAYSVYDSVVGYSQGTNFIVSLILANVNSAKDAFWIFVHIMFDKNWREMFINNTPKLISSLNNLLNQIKKRLKDLYDHFENENFVEHIPGVFTHYFTTIFSYNTPIEYSNRILDLFWVYDDKIIVDTLIHLLNLKKSDLLGMNMEELIIFLKNDLVRTCIKDFSFEKSLLIDKNYLEEKEIIIEL